MEPQRKNLEREIIATMAPQTKPVAKAAATAQPGSSAIPDGATDADTYEELFAKLEARKGERIDVLFTTRVEQNESVKATEAELFKIINDPEKQDEHLLMLAVNHAGDNGLPLSEARLFIREPNDLNKVRKSLLERKDENGNEAPLIREKQGKNNKLRIFAVKQESAEQQ